MLITTLNWTENSVCSPCAVSNCLLVKHSIWTENERIGNGDRRRRFLRAWCSRHRSIYTVTIFISCAHSPTHRLTHSYTHYGNRHTHSVELNKTRPKYNIALCHSNCGGKSTWNTNLRARYKRTLRRCNYGCSLTFETKVNNWDGVHVLDVHLLSQMHVNRRLWAAAAAADDDDY